MSVGERDERNGRLKGSKVEKNPGDKESAFLLSGHGQHPENI